MKKTIKIISAGFAAIMALVAVPLTASADWGCRGIDCMYPGGATSSLLSDTLGTLLSLIVLLVVIISLWKIFQKAGQPGWKAIIPIYNMVIVSRMANFSAWYVILFFIPIVNIIAGIIVYIRLSKAFGKSPWFALGLVLVQVVFLAILGFDKSTYRGPYYKGEYKVSGDGGNSDSSANSASAPTYASAGNNTSAPIDTTATSDGGATSVVPEQSPNELK